MDGDESSARIGERLEAQRARINAAIDAWPELAHLVDCLKEKFGALELVYLVTPALEHGADPGPGVVPIRYYRPKEKAR